MVAGEVVFGPEAFGRGMERVESWGSFKSGRRSPGGDCAEEANAGVVCSFTEGGRCFCRVRGGLSRRIEGWAREGKLSAGGSCGYSVGNRGFAGGKLFPQGSGGFVLRSKMSPLMSGKVLPAGVVFPLAGVGFSLVGEDIFSSRRRLFPAAGDIFLAGETISGRERGFVRFGRGGAWEAGFVWVRARWACIRCEMGTTFAHGGRRRSQTAATSAGGPTAAARDALKS